MTTLEQLPLELRTLKTQPLFIMNVAVGRVHAAGGPTGALRRIGDLTGGTFMGDRLSGVLVPGGTDWQTLRSDGATLLDARVVLRTDDGALIAMTYGGIRHGPPDVIAQIGRGEAPDPAAYYFRITATFATSAPRYDWLNRAIAIGIGHRLAGGPIYNVLEIV